MEPNMISQDDLQNDADTPEVPESIASQYFGPEQLAEASPEIDKAIATAAAAGCPVLQNFDGDNFPEGYGIGIRGVSKRGQPLLAVLLVAVPDVSTIAEHERGAQWIQDQITSSLLERAASAVRPRGDEPLLADSSALPFSVDDFIAPAKRGEGLATFRALASDYVKVLKKRGIPFLSVSLFRQILESRAFAESQFPNIAQEKWETVLGAMIGTAKKRDLDPAILQHWLETRDSVEVQVGDLSLDGLDDLV